MSYIIILVLLSNYIHQSNDANKYHRQNAIIIMVISILWAFHKVYVSYLRFFNPSPFVTSRHDGIY